MKDNNYFGYKKSIVFLNNCSSHWSSAVRQAMNKNKINIWYLPPYSYMLAPVEKAF